MSPESTPTPGGAQRDNQRQQAHWEAPQSIVSFADRVSRLPAPRAELTDWPWTLPPAAEPPITSDSSQPMVSIIIPSFNQGAFIEATLRSVLLQDYDAVEILVVDGGSSDTTLEQLERYSPWLRWISEPDRGQAHAINKGLRAARGQILGYLNSDDLLTPGAVRAAVNALGTQPDAGLVYGDCEAIDHQGQFLYRIAAPPYDRRAMILRGTYIPQPGTFWSRLLQEQIGLFDESLHFTMDHDFFIRAGEHLPVIKQPRVQSCFRLHPYSKTESRSYDHWREALRVSERYGLGPWSPWYWIRRGRHHGLRLLPRPLQAQVLRLLGRPDWQWVGRRGRGT